MMPTGSWIHPFKHLGCPFKAVLGLVQVAVVLVLFWQHGISLTIHCQHDLMQAGDQRHGQMEKKTSKPNYQIGLNW